MLCMDNEPSLKMDRDFVVEQVQHVCDIYQFYAIKPHTVAMMQHHLSLCLTEAGYDSRKNIDLFVLAGKVLGDVMSGHA